MGFVDERIARPRELEVEQIPSWQHGFQNPPRIEVASLGFHSTEFFLLGHQLGNFLLFTKSHVINQDYTDDDPLISLVALLKKIGHILKVVRQGGPLPFGLDPINPIRIDSIFSR